MGKLLKEYTNEELLAHVTDWNKRFVEYNNSITKTNFYVSPELVDLLDMMLTDIHYLLGLQIIILERLIKKEI